jgi:hypothetical protein
LFIVFVRKKKRRRKKKLLHGPRPQTRLMAPKLLLIKLMMTENVSNVIHLL